MKWRVEEGKFSALLYLLNVAYLAESSGYECVKLFCLTVYALIVDRCRVR